MVVENKCTLSPRLLFTDLPVPPAASTPSASLTLKYVWPDNSVRPLTARIQDYNDFEAIINDSFKNRFITGDGSAFVLLLNKRRPVSEQTSVLTNEWNKNWQEGLEKINMKTPSRALPNALDHSSWIPRVLNQGLLGDCYSNSAALVICAAYGKRLRHKYTDREIKGFLDTILPSRSMQAYLYNSLESQYLPRSTLLSQGGFTMVVLKLVQLNHGICLENSYDYPLIINFLDRFYLQDPVNYYQVFQETVPCDTQLYLISDYFSKFVESPAPQLLTLNPLFSNYYKKGQTYLLIGPEDQFWSPFLGSPNNLYGLAQKVNAFGQLVYYNQYGQETTDKTNYGVPASSYQVYLDLLKYTLSTDMLVNVNLPIFTNFPNGGDYTYYPPRASDTFDGGHAITAIGYDDTLQKVLLRNSWGPSWGLQGNFWLSYSFLEWMLSYQGLLQGGASYMSTFSAFKLQTCC
jgi:hypothetical protein